MHCYISKFAFTAACCVLAALSAGANNDLTARDTITDNNIVYPSSFDTDVRALQDSWYMKRYAVMDSVAKRRSGAEPSDEVYISRLQKLPTIIDMPFNSVVKKYIEMYAFKKPELVEKMLGMSLYYMPFFENALEQEQMPLELKYLPVIESALNPNAVSRVGACGLWQFMPATAQGEGLEISSLVDERRDPISSSIAACRYLKKLYNTYNDWTLAIAAYNCGPGNVNKAIKRSGNDKADYWTIYPYLPAETRGYVPAFIAANYIMTYYPEHNISHALARRPIVTDTVHVTNRVHFQQISDVMDIPMSELRTLNPQYRQDVIPGHIRPYALILPSEQAYCFVANVDTIVNHEPAKYFGAAVIEPNDGSVKQDAGGQYVEELTIVTHKVKKGETLKSIAKKYGVTVQSIRKASKITSSKVKTGAVLKVPTYSKRYVGAQDAQTADADSTAVKQTTAAPAKTAAAKPAKANTSKPSAPAATSKPKSYKVKKGDTLDRIAKKHGTTVKALQDANGIKGSNIRAGQTLKIPTTKAATSGKSSSKSKKSSRKR